jgi:hypothetical protein
VLYLSGLTCTDENFTQKAGAQRKAAELGLAIVAPDTSPRGLGIEGEDDRCDAGQCPLLAAEQMLASVDCRGAASCAGSISKCSTKHFPEVGLLLVQLPAPSLPAIMDPP